MKDEVVFVSTNGAENFNKWKSCALYMRISREDGDVSESASIENQRKILRNYAKDNGFIIYDEYTDDGFTGTDFERPEFKRLKEDIITGKIGIVLTKDFSRLGRNTGQVMTMLDDFFVRNGVRYISITEGIDTLSSDITGMLAPMLSFTNELYSGDISRKINASFAAKMREGEFIGAFAPYGYKKDPENKNHLLPDEEAGEIVKRVFFLAKEGASPKQIADMLNGERVPTPSKYRFKTHIHLDEESQKISEKWKTETVSRLLRNEVYLGHTVQGKTHKISFKSRHIENVPKDKWIAVLNTHKALVDRETWDIVRKRMESRTRVRSGGFSNLFSGIAKCADCGRNMSTVGIGKKGHRYNLNCGGYKQSGPDACLTHCISYDDLYNIVLEILRSKISFSSEERELLTDEMLSVGEIKKTKTQDAKRKLTTVLNKLSMLYDKKFSGEIDDDSFKILRAKYESEKENLEKIITEEEKYCVIKTDENDEDIRRREANMLIKKYEDLSFLDSNIIFKLIERIDVHKAEYEGKIKHQRIDIYFKFCAEEKTILFPGQESQIQE